MEMPLPLRSVHPDEDCYLIIDPTLCASQQNFHHACSGMRRLPLFWGTVLENYLDVSPIIIQVSDYENDIAHWFWNEENISTGICVVSGKKISDIKDHFSSFIFQTRYDDEQLLWRLYDPFVLHDIDITMSEEVRKKFYLRFV